MRNHSRLIAQSKDAEKYEFVQITEEEQQFLEIVEELQEKRSKNSSDINVEKVVKSLSILSNYIPNLYQLTGNFKISDLIDAVFKDDEIKEKIYNELFSAGVYIDEDGEIDLAQGLEHIRKVLFTNEKEDQKISEVLSDCTIDDLKKLGILYLDDEKTITMLKKMPMINEEGFIIGGKLPGLFMKNIFTGTFLDGPEDDPLSVDYYGCHADGYDSAGYDRYGFNKEGIHKVTQMPYDERMFTKSDDGRWYNIESVNAGRDGETDLLGYNHEGINPENGFDRDGYWHKKNIDGTYSIERYKYDESDPKLDCHSFDSTKNHYFLGIDYKTKHNEFYYTGTTDGKKEKNESNTFNSDGYDQDGFDRKGFNRRGIHRDTSTCYSPEGKNREGIISQDYLQTINKIEQIIRNGLDSIRT